MRVLFADARYQEVRDAAEAKICNIFSSRVFCHGVIPCGMLGSERSRGYV